MAYCSVQFQVVALFLLGGCPRMAIFRNLRVRLRFESSKYLNVFLRLKSSPSLTLEKYLILGQPPNAKINWRKDHHYGR